MVVAEGAAQGATGADRERQYCGIRDVHVHTGVNVDLMALA